MSGDPRLELQTRLIVLEVINVVQDGLQSAGFICFFFQKWKPETALGLRGDEPCGKDE